MGLHNSSECAFQNVEVPPVYEGAEWDSSIAVSVRKTPVDLINEAQLLTPIYKKRHCGLLKQVVDGYSICTYEIALDVIYTEAHTLKEVTKTMVVYIIGWIESDKNNPDMPHAARQRYRRSLAINLRGVKAYVQDRIEQIYGRIAVWGEVKEPAKEKPRRQIRLNRGRD
jgi:hypothetical protein